MVKSPLDFDCHFQEKEHGWWILVDKKSQKKKYKLNKSVMRFFVVAQQAKLEKWKKMNRGFDQVLFFLPDEISRMKDFNAKRLKHVVRGGKKKASPGILDIYFHFISSCWKSSVTASQRRTFLGGYYFFPDKWDIRQIVRQVSRQKKTFCYIISLQRKQPVWLQLPMSTKKKWQLNFVWQKKSKKKIEIE